MKQKIIIYQLLPRLFGNTVLNQAINGTIERNGCGKFNDITGTVLSALSDFGITHIWLTGILRHATGTGYPAFGLHASHPDIVKGLAGSPYAVNDYYDVDPDLAVDVPSRMLEFNQLVERIHAAGLKVIIDFIPNHVARDYFSIQLPAHQKNLGIDDNKEVFFSPSNNYYYFPGEQFRIRGLKSVTPDRYYEFPARATGNDVFCSDPEVNDWYETVKLNYGIDYLSNNSHFHPKPDTWIKMTSILLFWAGRGIDGFRCDMAGMVPVDFWHYSVSQVKSEFPHIIFIAELYEPHKYRDYLENGFFDYLYDKVGMYDTLRQVIRGQASTRAITGIWQSLEGMDNSMVRFLENHDEQRTASRYFAGDPWKALPGMALCALMNRGPVLIYSGQEVGEPAEGSQGFSGDDGRTSIFDYSAMPELQKWFNHGLCDGAGLSENQTELRNVYSGLLQLARRYPVFTHGDLYDLMWVNEDIPQRDKVFAFLRFGGTQEDEAILVAVCFNSEQTHLRIKIGEHAINSIGFGTKTRIKVKSISPETESTETFLLSQVITVGLDMTLNQAGYSVLSIS